MFETYIELYLAYLENINRSQKTINDYKKQLNAFLKFLQQKKVEEVEQVRTLHIDLYATELIKRKNTSTTRRKKMNIVKKFFEFLHTREYIEKNPTVVMDQIKVKDVDKKQKYVLTKKETEKLMRIITNHAQNPIKSRLLIYVMLKCGLRVEEVTNLQISDVDIKKKTIRIFGGKGGKTRHVPIIDEMIADLKAHIKVQKKRGEYLFTSKNTEKPMSTRSVHKFVKDYIKKAKIDKVIGCHALRRTAATDLLKKGVRITSIQKFLGHSNIATTEMYLLENESEVLDEIRDKMKGSSK